MGPFPGNQVVASHSVQGVPDGPANNLGLQLATNRYRAGYSSHREKFDAERALLGVQLSPIQARADQLSAESLTRR